MVVRPEHVAAVGLIVCDLARHGESIQHVRIGDHVLTDPELLQACNPRPLDPECGKLSPKTNTRLAKLHAARSWITRKATQSRPVRSLTEKAAAYTQKVRPLLERNPELIGRRIDFEVTLQSGSVTVYPMFVPDTDRFDQSVRLKKQTLWSLGANAALGVPFGWVPATGAIIPGLMALWNGAAAAFAKARNDEPMSEARKAIALQHAAIALPAMLPYGEIAVAGAAAAIHKRQLDVMKKHGPTPYFVLTGPAPTSHVCDVHSP